MAFVGIINEQEFYSQHYLDENLSGDIAGWVKEKEAKEKESREAFNKLTEAEKIGRDPNLEIERTPWSKLNSEAVKLLRRMNEAQSIKDQRTKVEEEKSITARLMSLLGLPAPVEEDVVEDGAYAFPLFAEKKSSDGNPYLWVLNAVETQRQDDSDPDSDYKELLSQPIIPEQFKDKKNADLEEYLRSKDEPWRTVINKKVFAMAKPPRWVILAGVDEWILIDRMKFGQQRFLRFDWKEILQRRNEVVLKIVSYLLGNDAFTENNGESFLTTLDENSFKHAHGVSEDLKYALREAVEILGNEAARQLKDYATKTKTKFPEATEISDECLRYLYRLLFLFFVESRPDLKYAPMNDPHYVDGYSLEWLRDLEMIPLICQEDQEGRFLNDSIQKLFKFFSKGTQNDAQALMDQHASAELFKISGLPSTLFDPSRMQLLANVVFPNKTLQRVIELMSLTGPKRSKGKKSKRRGRISYAHLGLNQLGAVYEALLSYQGFFAKETLYEVKRKKDKEPDILAPAFFVTADQLEKYSEDEKVYGTDELGQKKLRSYPRGSFVYRMSGRARETSASYYTPEVLTKCVVKESLEVLVEQQLKDLPDDKAKAERILQWRICEPAMGSAAFLNEAVNQVAELYMLHAQKVMGAKVLTQSEYNEELQKVKMFIADKNIYGVDLNPVAVELAEVSIWLNALSSDHYVPWFGLQLHCGNSLIGCRRNAYKMEEIKAKGLAKARIYNFDFSDLPSGYIWQFLLPNPEMSNYSDKTIKSLEAKNIGILRKSVKDLNTKFSEAELCSLDFLSQQIELLWQTWSQKLARLEEATTDTYSIYGHADKEKKKIPYAEKMELLKEARYGDGSIGSGEYSKLKTIMDYWCSLWGWPIQKADIFPTRAKWIKQIKAILSDGGKATERGDNYEQADLFDRINLKELSNAQSTLDPAKRRERLGEVFPEVAVINNISEAQKFLHWPLRFAQVFLQGKKDRRGFDLTVGNPPWIVSKWDAAGMLGEFDPIFVVHDEDYSAKGIDDVVRGKKDASKEGTSYLDSVPVRRKAFLHGYEMATLSNLFFASTSLYPLLSGTYPNLFKVFLPVVWANANNVGVQGLLHPETPYTETKGVLLRKELYSRIRRHFQFANERLLFPDVHHHREFSINVCGKKERDVRFISINNLYLPITIEQCKKLEGNENLVISKRTKDGDWNVLGDKSRILEIDSRRLNQLADLLDDDPIAPKLPFFQVARLLKLVEVFDSTKHRLSDLVSGQGFFISVMWDENAARKKGIIKDFTALATRFPPEDWKVIYNGPHISLGQPFFKCPRNPCLNNLDWELIDLSNLPDDYLPRVKYVPAETKEEYLKNVQKFPKDSKKLFTDYYRLAYRTMIGSADSERSLNAAIIPPFFSHINGIHSVAFEEVNNLIIWNGLFISLPIDFYSRLQGKSNLNPGLISKIPRPNLSQKHTRSIAIRVLALNCLTKNFALLWKLCWKKEFSLEIWSEPNPQLPLDYFSRLSHEWTRDSPLRTELARRQALLEIDVIVAQAFGLTLEDLLFIYRSGFRVMRGYDQETYYDQNGRIVFTPNRGGLPGAGLPRNVNFQRFPTLDAKKLVNAPKMSAHHRGICHF